MKKSKIKKNCGMCIGLDTPYYGSTCRNRLKKKETSKICSDFIIKETEWDDIRLKDTFLKKLFKKVKTYKVDKTLVEELNLYYIASYKEGNKEIRNIPIAITKKSMNRLVGLFEKNQAYKDRVVQIESDILKSQSSLEALKSAAEAYLYKTYGDKLGTLKSESIRRIIIDDILQKINSKIRKFDIIAETATLVKDNLHNTHFTLTNIKDIGTQILREKLTI